jgi:cell division initiation protein
MALTPLDIHNREFHRGFRGYREEEVDEFLDEVVREFESLVRDNAGLKGRIDDLQARLGEYQSVESTLRETLVVAQQAAEDVKANARKEAELVIREAENEAERRIQAAKDETRRLGAEADELQKRLYVLRSRLRGMITTHLELLDRQVEDIEAEQGPPAPAAGPDAETVLAPPVKEE